MSDNWAEDIALEIIETTMDLSCSCWLNDSPCSHCDPLVEKVKESLMKAEKRGAKEMYKSLKSGLGSTRLEVPNFICPYSYRNGLLKGAEIAEGRMDAYFISHQFEHRDASREIMKAIRDEANKEPNGGEGK